MEATMRRDWKNVGLEYCPVEDRSTMEAEIEHLEWHSLSQKDVPFSQGEAIKAVIQEFRLPKVSQVAWNGVIGDRYALLGIECNYENGRVRLYVLDHGCGVCPICVDFWENEVAPV